MPPGLNLISSNRVETLLGLLAEEIAARPPTSPFSTETVVVPSPAMARWVNLNLAQENGIAANIHYPLPATWIWEIARGLLEGLPEIDPLSRETAAWKIFFLLPRLLDRQEFIAIKRYLHADPDGIKRWQLSMKIAGVFDRYQFYRPDWISDWCAGKDCVWQALLWRELIETIQSLHRIEVIDAVLASLNQPASNQRLPERVSLFAISSLAPLFVDVIHHLARHTRVLLFLHSPSEHYWADLSSKKTIARLRVRSPDKARYHESGHEILASWGRQGQVLQDLLLSHEGLESETTEIYHDAPTDCLLHEIQRGILSLDPEGRLSGSDESIQVHIGHGPFRECQILHDNLLAILDADATLRPEDILVMVPEIGRFAPYIEAVFGKAENELRPFIPWNLSDITIAEEHSLLAAFLRIVSLPESRFTQSEILSLLDLPEVAQRFELDAEAVETIHELTRRANVRWGIDAIHKLRFKLPAIEDNTWHQAGRRFFAGYALGSEDCWNDIAPIAAVEGEKAVLIGRFWQLLQSLFDCREELLVERSGMDWQIYLNALLDRFFSEDESGEIQPIRDALDELHQATSQGLLSRQLVLYWLRQYLSETTRSGRYFSGGVTFCGMRPMRSLPFRVICLIGMNERAFPRRVQKAEFDLMTQNWNPGDPSRGDEDRYLLLETLLCARQILYISYTGRDPRDNSVREPSVLVKELLDFIDRYSPRSENSDTKPSDALIQVHPMHAFSPKNYANGQKSYDKHWFRIAKALANPKTPSNPKHWPASRIARLEQESRRIELFRVHQFLKHPVRFFFNTRLKIRIDEKNEIEDSESFSMDALEQWKVKSMIAEDFLRRKDLASAKLQAAGMLPHGSLGPFYLDRIYEQSRALFDSLHEYQALVPESRPIEWVFPEDFCLCGKVQNVYPGKGLLHFTASKFKGSHLLRLWLDHLCLSLAENAQCESSHLICRDRSWHFPALQSAQAEEMLWKILERFLQALEKPPAILPEASAAWASSYLKGNIEQAFKQAKSKWEGNFYTNIAGEKDDVYLRIVLRDIATNPIDDPEFARCSLEFYEDALKFAEPR